LGQAIGAIFGLLTAFLVTFVILMFGSYIPTDVVSSAIVNDFLGLPDLEIKLAVVGTVLYPPYLGGMLSYGASQSTVLMAVAWGTGGLVAGLLARDFVQGIFAAIFAVIIGALLTWLIVFINATTDLTIIFSDLSLLIMQNTLQGALYPGIAAVIGGILGGGITRRR
jgi:hypothetical protein